MAVILEGNCEFEFCQRQYTISKVLCDMVVGQDEHQQATRCP